MAACQAPNEEEKAATAAEERIPAILPMLKSFASQRHSLTMEECVSRIRDSARNPLSLAQAEAVVERIVSTEAWVQVRRVQGITGVVFSQRDAHRQFV